MEIQKDLFDMLNRFELDDLSILNEWDRHIEHFEQTEQSLNRRACAKAESVEDTVLRNIEYEQLHQAISMLTETQQRRLKLYYFRGLTYKLIAEMEGCSTSAVVNSISAAIENIRKFFPIRVEKSSLSEDEGRDKFSLPFILFAVNNRAL